MQLSELLTVEAVRTLSEASSKKRLFQRLGDIVDAAYGVNGGEAIDALLERESLGPTGVGEGIALPHARLPGLETISGVFLRLDRPVDFGAVDRQPVDLIFALFAPEESGVDHLKALAIVSRTMRDKATCTKLRANSDPIALHAILTSGPETQAA